jgi:hypothetical protein
MSSNSRVSDSYAYAFFKILSEQYVMFFDILRSVTYCSEKFDNITFFQKNLSLEL